MTKDRLKPRGDHNPPDTIEAQLGRLASANALVQGDIEARLWSRPSLEAQHELLTAIVNQLPELVYAKDTKGRFVAANDAVARDNGLSDRPTSSARPTSISSRRTWRKGSSTSSSGSWPPESR